MCEEVIKLVNDSLLYGWKNEDYAIVALDYFYNNEKIIEKHGISPERMGEIMDVIINATPEEREKIPAIGKDRADIILAGAVFVKSLIKAICPQGFVVADVGVREGVAIDYAQNHGII